MKKIMALGLVLMMVFGAVAIAEEPLYISVVSKGEQHAFWQAVRKGCEDAAEEYGVDMYYYGPPSESDIQLQVEALNVEMLKVPDAIVLAALSTESVMTQLEDCVAHGIPVIGFDSGVPNAPEGAIYATASTNNQNAAALAAEELIKLDGFTDALAAGTPEAPVVIACLSQDATPESITSRTTGFINKMYELASAYNTVSVEGHDLWAQPAEDAGVILRVEVSATTDITDITNAATSLLNTDGLFALFCSNEGAVSGLLAATSGGADLGEDGPYSHLLVAGFDASAPQKEAVRNGWFVGSVTQDPYRIGYLGVELAVKAANGEEVSDIDTGAKWYTAENIDDPDIAMLVYD